ncbi:AAA ATPase domain-containing protein [Halopseudomonas litoralis]|uniref:AAA ATPase domain-containing protein n=1 Tax=Halopseudomonas litoralis TaxID=797277 RepID=A0A1H1LN35_9GAMM|nr:AAA family ATPase [Halopseudomonas litoralis]SDR75951.1 AAA ATPase domain-containing protein [Halopseudomonas litoralis]
MIVGVILRYYKTYRGINYIPITDQDRFCGLVGDNGIGKSSVLEALDSYFNGKPWSYHTATKKTGVSSAEPQIVPIFLVDEALFDADTLPLAQALHKVATELTESEVPPKVRVNGKRFIEHRDHLLSRANVTDKLLLPLGIDYNGSLTVSWFNNRSLVEALLGEEQPSDKSSLDHEELSRLFPLLSKVKSKIEYIYIPREIDPESFTKLETSEIQILMGETLVEILSSRVTHQQIQDINTRLNQFLEQLTNELEIYSYRTPTDRQQNLKRSDVYSLIIQAFFRIRKLHRKQGDHWLEISSLSSGEKQKAIIDVAHSLLTKHRGKGENLIIGIDEPESSLHMSACFDQFDALYDISRDCMQVLFSSHWYGFLPTIESGSATIISKVDDTHVFDQINLAAYREQIKRMAAFSKGRLPHDIRLKSINDFVQSVITSVIGDKPFNWLICEGSSEKLYLSAYFADLIEKKRLRIVPVGGAREIKRLYNHLLTSYEDFKDEISGKIILISDTDSELVRYDVASHKNLICKRIVNCEAAKDTKLVNIQANPVSPATEIEDALNGRLFWNTLLDFQDEYAEKLGFMSELDVDPDDRCPHLALDLRGSERQKLQKFFDTEGVKYAFAQRYVQLLDDSYTVPAWINEIRGWVE